MSGSRAWLERDFYAVLGVPETASADEIKRAYKKLARQFHPDKNPGNKAAEEKMKDVSEANQVLGDLEQRAEYDNMRRLGRGGGGFGGGFSEGFDLSDLFGGAFRGGRSRGRAAPRRGADLETTVRLAFEQAVQGATVPVRLMRDVACVDCKGSGDTSGSATVCSGCRGSGMVQEAQGMFAFARPCPQCGGAGRQVVNACPTCAGAGVVSRSDEVRVKIPAGVNDGARIRVRARGAQVSGGTPGDLFVVVTVAPHAVLTRTGDDVRADVEVTFAQAVLGATVKAPTIEGSVSLKVPPGTQSGKVFRVRGRGVPSKGDLLVTIRVKVPTTLTDEQQRLIERLAALEGTRQPDPADAADDSKPEVPV